MMLNIKTSQSSYNVIINKGVISNASAYLKLERKVLIVHDENVPTKFVDTLKNQCQEAYTLVFPSGEENKDFKHLEYILSNLLENSFSRRDCVIALGGGVVGDIAGLASSLYMRGIDFYNIPTTLLSMVDSSIGGKTAIDFMGVKNPVGAFYPPKAVLIDIETLDSLDERQINAGLAEAIKMAITFSPALFDLIKSAKSLKDKLEDIIISSLQIKKFVVEQDEKESNIRRSLNFGHTLGHAFESLSNGKLLHGEAVAIGMTYMVNEEIKPVLLKVLKKYKLPTSVEYSKEDVLSLITHDKKIKNDGIDTIVCNEIGTYQIKTYTIEELGDLL